MNAHLFLDRRPEILDQMKTVSHLAGPAVRPAGLPAIRQQAIHTAPLREAVPIRDPDTGHVISPVVAAAPCLKPRSMLTISQARSVDALKQDSPEFASMRSLALRFVSAIFPAH